MEIIIEGVTAKAFLNIIGEFRDDITGYYFDNYKKLYIVYLNGNKNLNVCTYTYGVVLKTSDGLRRVAMRNKDFGNMIIQ